jgi:hypothetical protein
MNRIWYDRPRSEAQVLSEPALTDSEAHLVLRRQFIGSVAAAMIVVAIAGLTALRPAHEASVHWSPHFATVQQPTFATPGERLVAMKQNGSAATSEPGGRAGM